MRGVRRALVLGAGLTLAACSAAPPAATPTPSAVATPTGPRAERPTYAVGERWSRNDGLFDLVRIEGDRYVFAAATGREMHLTRDLGVAKLQRGESVLEFDPPPKPPWPLEVGKKETSSGVMRTPQQPKDRRVQFTWSVDAYEDVQVIAGTFKAFRLTLAIDRAQADRRWELQTWYAPEARQFVKGSSADMRIWNFQVLAVDRPATAPLQVALAEPKDQERVTTEGIAVTGKVTSDKGVARVAVSLNGQEVSAQEERGAPKGEIALRVPVKLREGRNVLLVTATDATGATRQEARTVFYDRAPPGGAPGPATAPATGALQVTLASPRDQARVEQETIGLAGVVSGGKGVSRVTVTLNGVEVSRQEEPTPQRSLALNLPLKLRDGPNTLVVTAAEADGTIHQEVRTVVHEKPVPLTIAVRYPEDRARLADEATVVAAVITSSKGVAQVRVTLNGAQVHEQSERATQRSLAVTVPVTLREGTNAIVISASEPDGTVRQEIRTVVLDRPKVVAAPPPQPAPDRWAVVIGVGDYEHAEIPRLRYTVKDAEVIAETLIGPGGFKKDNVLVLTDKTQRKPTIRHLRWALGTFLARNARKDDTVLIFFAGHGAPEVDPRGLEKDGLTKYLVPIDADPDDLYSTALPMDEISTIFGRIEAERVVVFLDTCYSGAAGGRTFTSKKTRASHLDDLFLERLTRSKGRAIITASRPAEVSIELAELGHGLFTYYLVRGLQGAADLDRDGIVTLQELYQYIEQEVTRKSRAVGANQHPVMKGELEGVLPLVKVQRWEAPAGR